MTPQKPTSKERSAFNAGIDYALAAKRVIEASAMLQRINPIDHPTREEHNRGLEALTTAKSLFDNGLTVMVSIENEYTTSNNGEILRARSTIPSFRSYYDLLRQRFGMIQPEEAKPEIKYRGKKK